MSRSSAYQPNNQQSELTYQPIPNGSLVRSFASPNVAHEYKRIIDFDDLESLQEPSRELSVVTDTFIELQGQTAELIGDARFMFNALLAARRQPRLLSDLINYGDGFRGESHVSTATYQYTQVIRPIMALDAFALKASGTILVQRGNWGTGVKQRPNFAMKDDIVIRDKRS